MLNLCAEKLDSDITLFPLMKFYIEISQQEHLNRKCESNNLHLMHIFKPLPVTTASNDGVELVACLQSLIAMA